MKRKDGVGDSGIDWSRSGHWLGAGDEEEIYRTSLFERGLRTQNSSWEGSWGIKVHMGRFRYYR